MVLNWANKHDELGHEHTFAIVLICRAKSVGALPFQFLLPQMPTLYHFPSLQLASPDAMHIQYLDDIPGASTSVILTKDASPTPEYEPDARVARLHQPASGRSSRIHLSMEALGWQVVYMESLRGHKGAVAVAVVQLPQQLPHGIPHVSAQLAGRG